MSATVVESENFDMSEFSELSIMVNQKKALIYVDYGSEIKLNAHICRGLGDAQYAKILVSKERKVIAIKPCEKEDSNSVAIYVPSSKDGKRYRNRSIVELMSSFIADGKADNRYVIEGVYSEENNVMFFDFNYPKQIEKPRRNN